MDPASNQIRISDGHDATTRIARGSRVADGLTALGFNDNDAIAALVNNDVRSLDHSLLVSAVMRPISADSKEGLRVYRRSMCFAVGIAAKEAFPGRRLVVGHSLGNALYFSLADGALDESALSSLRASLTRLIASNKPIVHTRMGYHEAYAYFEQSTQFGSTLLLDRHNYAEVPVYRCGESIDLDHGPLATSTGVLTTWAIEAFQGGFLLIFPSAEQPDTAASGPRSSTLFSIYQEYKEWGRVLGVSVVGQLNKITEGGGVREFVRVAEALHNKKIAQIADQVHERQGARQGKGTVILIAGPSSSGKTTFSKKLSVQLRVLGYTPLAVSLDNYFVPRERTPRDENGDFDFECIEAIDIDLLNEHLLRLLSGESVDMPIFNFKTGQPEYHQNPVQLPEHGVLVLEGIHGLNRRLTPQIPTERTFKIYVSALTQLNLDDHTRISTTDNRLIRRMVRDHQFRGHSAAATLKMWPSVRRGEELHIFPYQDSADAAFNTALDYELGILRNHAEPLLRGVKPNDPNYHEAVRLQSFLRNFSPIPEKDVPADSILREFIGDSGFHY